MKSIKTTAIMAVVAMGLSWTGLAQTTPEFYSFAKTPPMGWNSWDSVGSSITDKDRERIHGQIK